MKAVIYTEYGAPEVLRLAEMPKPTPKDNEVLIKVHTTSVTTGDVNARGFVFVPPGMKFLARLMFGLNKPRNPMLGVEVAGEVEAVGKAVTQFKPGDPVFGLTGMGLGAYAEYRCMPESGCLAIKPANLTFEEAVTIPNGALTALTFLKNRGNIQPGQKILINGASGSVGSAAVQIAKHLGAEVIGVCSTANLEMVKALGADRVIDYTRTDFTKNGETYDAIMDTVGKTTFAGVKKLLKPNGLYMSVAGGFRELLQAAWTALRGGKKVVAGISSESKADLLFIKGLVEAGKLKPVVDRCYPMEQIVEAHRYVDSGRKKGNVVILVGGNS